MRYAIRPNILIRCKNCGKGINDLRKRGGCFFCPILEGCARVIARSAIGNKVAVMKAERGADFDNCAGLLPKLGNSRHQLRHPLSAEQAD